MIKSLFLTMSVLTGSLAFGQIQPQMETDENGKIRFYSHYQNHNFFNPDNPTGLELDWTEPDFNISNNPTVDSWDSRMEVGNDGKVYVVYNDNHSNGLQKIMFRKKVEDEWTAPIFVDAGGEIGSRNNHFPAITSSANGDLHVIYNVWAYENVRNYIGYSYYNAATDQWTDGLKISDLNGTVNHFNSRHDLYSTSDNLPVVVWGFDFRENQTNEEIYMKYFDGTIWSSDIPVSNITDAKDAGYPHIKSIGNNKAMIVYSEKNAGNAYELLYRIYDEATHDLSAPKTIASENININNYVLTTAGEEVKVLHLYKQASPTKDVLKVYNYDTSTDAFNLSDNSIELDANAGGLLKRVDMDCMNNGDCGIVFSDFNEETNSFLSYNETEGFGTPIVINNEDPGFDTPNIRLDSQGNAHVVWSDYRNNDGSGWDEREVFYKMGENTTMNLNESDLSSVAIYPNPSKGIFTIDTQENFQIEIYNTMGKLVNEQNISGKSILNTTLPSGVYLLKLSNSNFTEVRKIIIQ